MSEISQNLGNEQKYGLTKEIPQSEVIEVAELAGEVPNGGIC